MNLLYASHNSNTSPNSKWTKVVKFCRPWSELWKMESEHGTSTLKNKVSPNGNH